VIWCHISTKIKQNDFHFFFKVHLPVTIIDKDVDFYGGKKMMINSINFYPLYLHSAQIT
jgi:hypothetical protein